MRKRTDTLEDRFQILGAVSLVLALWGFAVGIVGTSLFVRGPRLPLSTPSHLGNGTPALLIGGGGATALIGLGLWAWTFARGGTFTPRWFSRIQRGTFLLGLASLAAAVAFRSDKSDIKFTLLGLLALLISAATWRLESNKRLQDPEPRRSF